MSSINPLFLLAGALKEKSRSLAEQYHASLTLGVGQFCTNPGLVVLPDGDASKEFLKVLGERIRETPHGVMLHRGIRRAYSEGVASREAHPDAKPLAVVKSGEGPGGCSAAPAVFTTDGKSFLKHREFGEEIFGPSAIVVLTSSAAEFERIAGSLEGQLTASIFGTEAELYRHGALVATLRRKAGRVLFNQFPTGVEVCHAMVHGGPYPATSDGRSTSVGTAAIGRFARPVCFQNFPQMALPSELQDENPLQIWRKEDGNFTK